MQVCGLSTIYCCYTVDKQPVDPEIPAVWPPIEKPVPNALRKANLNCASGNCTEAFPPPPALAPAMIPAIAPVPAPVPGPGQALPELLVTGQPGQAPVPAQPLVGQPAYGQTATAPAAAPGGAVAGTYAPAAPVIAAPEPGPGPAAALASVPKHGASGSLGGGAIGGIAGAHQAQ